MQSILISVPTFESIEPGTFKSIYGLAKPDGFNVLFDFTKGYDCARARNLIAKEAVQYNFDYVLMVDSDVILPANTLTVLLAAQKDIIFGWYPRKGTVVGQTELFALGHKDFVNENNINMKDVTGSEPVEIKGGGMGCALIKVSIFNTLKYPWFRYVEYDDGSVLSEDNYFCSQVTSIGYKVFYHPGIRCSHVSKVLL